VYASDEGNQRIQYFVAGQTNGSTLAGVTGVLGSSSTLLNTPSSVAIDSQFNIYAVDYGNQRVQKFVQC
jgi:NHL repeat